MQCLISEHHRCQASKSDQRRDHGPDWYESGPVVEDWELNNAAKNQSESSTGTNEGWP